MPTREPSPPGVQRRMLGTCLEELGEAGRRGCIFFLLVAVRWGPGTCATCLHEVQEARRSARGSAEPGYDAYADDAYADDAFDAIADD